MEDTYKMVKEGIGADGIHGVDGGGAISSWI
jgi:hypothetical protein